MSVFPCVLFICPFPLQHVASYFLMACMYFSVPPCLGMSDPAGQMWMPAALEEQLSAHHPKQKLRSAQGEADQQTHTIQVDFHDVLREVLTSWTNARATMRTCKTHGGEESTHVKGTAAICQHVGPEGDAHHTAKLPIDDPDKQDRYQTNPCRQGSHNTTILPKLRLPSTDTDDVRIRR